MSSLTIILHTEADAHRAEGETAVGSALRLRGARL